MPNDPGEQEISKTERNPEHVADFENLKLRLTPPHVSKGDALLLGPITNQWHITISRDDRRWGRQIGWTSVVTVTGIFEIVEATKLTAHLRAKALQSLVQIITGTNWDQIPDRTRTLLNDPKAVVIDAWAAAAGIAYGPVFRSVNRGGAVRDTALSEKVVWQLIRPYAETAGVNFHIKCDWQRFAPN